MQEHEGDARLGIVRLPRNLISGWRPCHSARVARIVKCTREVEVDDLGRIAVGALENGELWIGQREKLITQSKEW